MEPIYEDDIKELLKSLEVGLAIVSIDGYFEWCNKKFLDILEYSIAEMIKKKSEDITHPEDLHTDKELLRLLNNNEEDLYEVRKRYITKSGKIINVIVIVIRRYKNGKHVGYYSQIIPIDDISEKHDLPKYFSFGDFIKQHWKYFVSGAIFLCTIIISLGITIYGMYNKVIDISKKSSNNQALILKIIERDINKAIK